MNYGSMKTTFIQVMQRLQIPEVSIHDFAEAVDSAELFLAVNLPQDVVRGIIWVEDYNTHPSNLTEITKPSRFLKLESARLATTRVDGIYPSYLPVTVVTQKEFLAKAEYSSERIVCEFNKTIHVNPEPAPAVDNLPGSVEFVYRKKPRGYMSRADSVRVGAKLLTLHQDPSNSRLFHTDAVEGKLSAIGLNNELTIGGMLIIPFGPTSIGRPMIDSVYDDDTEDYTWIHVSDDYILYNSPTNQFSDAYVLERMHGAVDGTSFRPDSDEPDLGSEFHSLIMDLAIARFLLPLKPQEAGQYIGYATSELKAYGVTLTTEYGGHE